MVSWTGRKRIGAVVGVVIVVLAGLFFLALGVNVIVHNRLTAMENGKEQRMKEQEATPKLGYDDAEYDRMSEGFFAFASRDSPCVGDLDGVEWVYKNTPGYVSGFTTRFGFSKDGYVYDFFYVENTGRYDPYHLTVRVSSVEGGWLVHAASLRGNRFVTGIGAPVMGQEWKRLLDDRVRGYLDRDVPEVEQERWNRKVLEEYSAVLRCYYDESEEDKPEP